MCGAMNDIAAKLDPIDEEILSCEVSDKSLEIAAAASPNTTDWCAATSRCTAPAVGALLTKGGRIS